MAISNATVTWNAANRAASAPVRAQRVLDTEVNRRALAAEAARDGVPSAIVDMGRDIVLLSGTELVTASKVANSRRPALAAGMAATVAGIAGTTLATDDGFAEVAATEVIVAVIDTGLDVNHPAFRGKVVKPYNAVDGTTNVQDTQGHGTHVAGIIAGAWGIDPNAGGIAPQVKIMPIKTDRAGGAFGMNDMARAIRYAADNGAKVINMSLGGTEAMPAVDEAIRYAESKGAVVVVATGNAGRHKLYYPAVYSDVIAVGSSANGKRDGFSNGGERLDLTAPGAKVRSAAPGGGFAKKSGTSMAAPYVAAAAALVVARHPEWTPAQIRMHLQRATTDAGHPGWDRDLGYGEIDLFKAVYGENLPVVHRSAVPPKLTLWERFMGFLGLD